MNEGSNNDGLVAPGGADGRDNLPPSDSESGAASREGDAPKALDPSQQNYLQFLDGLSRIPAENREDEVESFTPEVKQNLLTQAEQFAILRAAHESGSGNIPQDLEGISLNQEQVDAFHLQQFMQASEAEQTAFFQKAPLQLREYVHKLLPAAEQQKYANVIAMSQAEADVNAAADIAEHAGENKDYDTDDEEKRKERFKDDSEQMLKVSDPEAGENEEARLQTQIEINDLIRNRSTLDPHESIEIAGKLHAMGIKKVGDAKDVDDYLAKTYPTLDQATRDEIKQHMPEAKGDQPEPEQIPDDKKERAKAMHDRVNEEEQKLDQEIEATSDPEKKGQLIAYKNRLRNLGLKLTDFFAEGEPGRDYARKGGKILYWAIMTAVIVILLEMNIIYKAAKSGGRR